MNIYRHKSIGSILLIAGTSIGAGMLALPMTTGIGGFFPSAILFVICFSYMLLALFLLLEANLYSTDLESNIISMARARLGNVGQIIAWVTFLLLLYAAVAAYLSGGGSLLANVIASGVHYKMSSISGIWLFLGIFGLAVGFGTWFVDYVNRFLMMGLIISYFALAVFVTPYVKWEHLSVSQPMYLFAGVPIVLLSFTSHIILPSLRTYLNDDVAQLKKVLWIGSMVPLVFYLLWQFVIVGVFSIDDLMSISGASRPIGKLTNILQFDLKLKWVALAVGSFSFFALVTSFLGVVLSLMDFLADGLRIKKTPLGRAVLWLMTLIPPLIFALYFPRGFVIALSYAGVFVAILYGILPAWMVWKARYVENLSSPRFRVPGGRNVLLISIIGAFLAIGFQVAATIHWLPTA